MPVTGAVWTEVCVYNLSLFFSSDKCDKYWGGWLVLSMNSAHLANWKYQESQGAQSFVSSSTAEVLCFCLGKERVKFSPWCMLTQALKSMNLLSELWFMQRNPITTIGRHRIWLSLLPGATISKLIKERNDKAGYWSLDPNDRQE